MLIWNRRLYNKQCNISKLFSKDEVAVIESQANLDIEVFTKIAKVLNINKRYVGEEPNSLVTNIYNQTMVKNYLKII